MKSKKFNLSWFFSSYRSIGTCCRFSIGISREKVSHSCLWGCFSISILSTRTSWTTVSTATTTATTATISTTTLVATLVAYSCKTFCVSTIAFSSFGWSSSTLWNGIASKSASSNTPDIKCLMLVIVTDIKWDIFAG